MLLLGAMKNDNVLSFNKKITPPAGCEWPNYLSGGPWPMIFAKGEFSSAFLSAGLDQNAVCALLAWNR
jgi:hypothetical protein